MNARSSVLHAAEQSTELDYINLRGHRLPLSDLVDPRLLDPAYVAGLRQQFESALPFPHLVVEGWFNPQLLSLVLEEFELFPVHGWRNMNNKYERTIRSQPGAAMGPAARLYFGLINSAWFLDLLSSITSVQGLIGDPKLYGGGLHESQSGGRFGIHRDFDRHVTLGLLNEMVFLTYLNRSWNAEWDGDLELWDGAGGQCVSSVAPEFGRSVLLKHGPNSYHGHPRPMNLPKDVFRRSLASYYYTNEKAQEQQAKRVTTVFLFSDNADRMRVLAKRWTPPALWEMVARLKRR